MESFSLTLVSAYVRLFLMLFKETVKITKGEDMVSGLSHSRDKETMIEKARWFQSLKVSERIQLFCGLMDGLIQLNPKVMDKKDDKPVQRSFQVLRKT